MLRLRMVRSPMAPADYADHIGTWLVGTVYDCTAEDASRKLSDFPGCFEPVEEPIKAPPHNAAAFAPPHHAAIQAPPQARTGRGRR